MSRRHLSLGQRRGRSGRPWQRVRRFVLQRDGYRCKVQLEGVCIGVATTVDHIVAIVDDPHGLRSLDPANLRAACKPCNSTRGAGPASEPSRRW
jgi:5-methylcytosine-specific restriction enzyme A